MSDLTKKKPIPELSWAFFIPLIAAVVFVPLIVRIHYYDTHLGDQVWFWADPKKLDVFHYWKNIWLSVCGGVMLCMTLFLFLKEGISRRKKMFIPLGIYALFCILSTIFSVSVYHSIHGFYDMFESIFCLLSYGMVCYYAYYIIRTEKNLKTAGIWVLVGAAVLGIIGTSQYFGHDIVMSKLGRRLMLPASYATLPELQLTPDQLSLTFGVGRVYETLYNPNYVGVYTAMILPLLVVLTVTVDKLQKLWIYVPLIILTMFSLVGSLSRAGMIAIIGSIVLFLIMFHTIIVKYWKQSAVIAVIMIIGVVGFDFARDHVISQRFMSIFNDTTVADTEPMLSSIQLNDEDYTLVYNGKELIFQNYEEEDNITPIVMDADGNQLSLAIETAGEGEEAYSYYVIDDPACAGLQMRPAYGGTEGDILGIQFLADGYTYFIFYSEADGTYYFQNMHGKPAKAIDSETADWKIFKMFGGFSGRGYIWSKSVPLLKDYIFLGSGPDTFSFVFPLMDVVDMNNGGYGNQVITKPHSMYLQTGIQTGMISLIAWLVFYGWYFAESFRLYFRKEYKTFAEKLGVGIMIATASYMISGIANDSNPSVAPIYWGILGIGIAANEVVRRTRQEEKEKQLRREQAIAQAKANREEKEKQKTGVTE